MPLVRRLSNVPEAEKTDEERQKALFVEFFPDHSPTPLHMFPRSPVASLQLPALKFATPKQKEKDDGESDDDDATSSKPPKWADDLCKKFSKLEAKVDWSERKDAKVDVSLEEEDAAFASFDSD